VKAMAEYIEREALENRIRLLPRLAPYNSVSYSSVQKAILDAPTADVVEVVRCKDCKHYKLRNVASTYKPSKPCCLRSAASKVSENDFCSFGERKEGTENGSK
jgi:hypothetical protein